jgi:hypothetical protein
MSVYVEILVRAPLNALWAHTQTPALHERWDLRFSDIDYLPKSADDAPQRFRYATRIGFGLEISGQGETSGQKEARDGSCTSALKFSSDEPLSLIREGSGYWKYIPTTDGIRFLTWYDYRTRFGAAGACFDRLIFRPLIGWATAWSFDRLRLWLEECVDPRVAVRHTCIHVAARMALALVFGYESIPALSAVLLFGWSRPWPVWLCLISIPIDPFIVKVSVAALAAIDLLALAAVPSAARCLRRPASEEP